MGLGMKTTVSIYTMIITNKNGRMQIIHSHLHFPPFCPQEDINAIDGLEDDKRDLISREISKFRDTHKVQ